jgi:type IV pilus assembly protein PilA
VELLLAVAIISVVSWFAVRSHQIALIKAEIFGSMLFAFDSAKRDNLVYLALHGKFPENTAQALSVAVTESYSSYETVYKDYSISVEHGAVNITFKRAGSRLAGKTLTMRPIMQDDDPTGAIRWVCNKASDQSGWNMYGIDRTDVDEKYIPADLK